MYFTFLHMPVKLPSIQLNFTDTKYNYSLCRYKIQLSETWLLQLKLNYESISYGKFITVLFYSFLLILQYKIQTLYTAYHFSYPVSIEKFILMICTQHKLQ